MTKLLRHIYDKPYSKLSPFVRTCSDMILSRTQPSILSLGSKRIKAKIGYISDIKDGADIHEVGIIDDEIILSVMLNKFDKNTPFWMKLLNGENYSDTYKEITNLVDAYYGIRD